MNRLSRRRLCLAAAFLATALISFNCGILLYPERRGNRGAVDVPVLIMDCAWLLAGVLPGVIALAVDFVSGGMYLSGGWGEVAPGDRVALRLDDPAPNEAALAVQLERPGAERPVAVLLERSLDGGERLGTVELVLPANLAPGEYQLTVRVNGAVNAARPVTVVR